MAETKKQKYTGIDAPYLRQADRVNESMKPQNRNPLLHPPGFEDKGLQATAVTPSADTFRTDPMLGRANVQGQRDFRQGREREAAFEQRIAADQAVSDRMIGHQQKNYDLINSQQVPEGLMEGKMSELDAVSIQQGIPGAPEVFKNVDAGRTIYGDSAGAVSNPWGAMQNQGAGEIDANGNQMGGFSMTGGKDGNTSAAVSMATGKGGGIGGLTEAENAHWNKHGTFDNFSIENQGMMQQPGQQGGGQQQGGINSFGAQQGQGGNWWDEQMTPQSMFSDAQKIMSRMPYGRPGDRAKRQSMLREAEGLMSMGKNLHAQGIADGRLALNQQQEGRYQQGQNFNQTQTGISNAQNNRQFGLDQMTANSPKYKTATQSVYDQLGQKSGEEIMIFDEKTGLPPPQQDPRKQELSPQQREERNKAYSELPAGIQEVGRRAQESGDPLQKEEFESLVKNYNKFQKDKQAKAAQE